MSRPGEDSSEPVRVYLRVRPEVIGESIAEGTIAEDTDVNDGSKDRKEFKECIDLMDDRTIRVKPTPSSLKAMSRKGSGKAMENRLFGFDKVFSPLSSQEDMYRHVSAHVNATVRGYNTTIFAYGSTGSGKTYTMTGDAERPGIIPRTISEIFSIIEATAAREKDVFFYVRMSYVELYNNHFRNLLDFASKGVVTDNNDQNDQSDIIDEDNEDGDDDGNRTVSSAMTMDSKLTTLSPSIIHPELSKRSSKIEVRESKSAGIFLAGPNLRIPVTTAREAFKLVNRGNKYRATSATKCNDYSSRSHAILTVHVESRIVVDDKDNAHTKDAATADSTVNATTPKQKKSALDTNNKGKGHKTKNQTADGAELRLGKMHLVDLAGSERISMSGAEGDTLLETQSINSSLTAIGDVLAALSRNATLMQNKENALNNSRASLNTSMSTINSTTSVMTAIPIPYRNSKLTHLLKDSLGGNSKTIMIATVRNNMEFYHQTVVSLMYASRAKKVRNKSSVNRNVIGDTGIHTVSNEINRLKTRLDDRSSEFDRLRSVHLRELQENTELKSRLRELHTANEAEKRQLEEQMSHIIHSQAGEIATQRKKISKLTGSLQDELIKSKSVIAEQGKEIEYLKNALLENETSAAGGPNNEQFESLNKAIEDWKTQALTTQQDLDIARTELNEIKKTNQQYTKEIGHLALHQNQALDNILERQRESQILSTALERMEKEKLELLKTQDNALMEVNSVKIRFEQMSETIIIQDDEIQQHKEMVQKHNDTISSLVEEKERLQSLLEEKESHLDTHVSNSEKNISTISDLEGQVNYWREQHTYLSNKMATTLQNLQQQSIDTIEDIQQKYNQEVENVLLERQSSDNLRKELLQLQLDRDSHISSKTDLHSQVEEMTRNYEKALEEKQQEMDKQEENFKSFIEQQNNLLQLKSESSEQAIDALQRKYDSSLKEKQAYEYKYKALETSFRHKVVGINAKFSQHVKGVTSHMQNKQKEMKDKLGLVLVNTTNVVALKQLQYFKHVLEKYENVTKQKIEYAILQESSVHSTKIEDLAQTLKLLENEKDERNQRDNEKNEQIKQLQNELKSLEQSNNTLVEDMRLLRESQQLSESRKEVELEELVGAHEIALTEATQSLELLREEHRVSLELLEKKHNVAMREATESLEQSRISLQSLESEMQSLREHHEQDKNSHTTNHSEEIQSLKDEHQIALNNHTDLLTALREHVQSLTEEKEVLEITLKEEIESNLLKYKQQLLLLGNQHEESLSLKDEEIERQEKSIREKLQSLEQEYHQNLQTLETEWRNTLHKHEDTITLLRKEKVTQEEQHRTVLENIRSQFDDNVSIMANQFTDRGKEEIQNALQKQKDTMDKHYRSEMNTLEEKYNSLLETKDTDNTKLDAQIKSLTDEFEVLKQTLDKREQELTESKEDLEKKEEKIGKQEMELLSLSTEMNEKDGKIDQLTIQMDEAQKEEREKEKELTKLRSDVHNLRESHETAVQDLARDYELRIESALQEHSDKVEGSKDESLREMEQLFQKQLSEKDDEIIHLNGSVRQMTSTKEQLERRLDTEIGQIRDHLDIVEKSSKEELQRAVKKATKDLGTQHDKALQELKEKHKKAIEMKADEVRALDVQLKDVTSQLTTLRLTSTSQESHIEILTRDYESQKKTLLEEISLMKSRYKNSLEMLQKQNETNSMDRQKQVDELVEDMRLLRESQQLSESRKEVELEELVGAHEIALTEATQSLELLREEHRVSLELLEKKHQIAVDELQQNMSTLKEVNTELETQITDMKQRQEVQVTHLQALLRTEKTENEEALGVLQRKYVDMIESIKLSHQGSSTEKGEQIKQLQNELKSLEQSNNTLVEDMRLLRESQQLSESRKEVELEELVGAHEIALTEATQSLELLREEHRVSLELLEKKHNVAMREATESLEQSRLEVESVKDTYDARVVYLQEQLTLHGQEKELDFEKVRSQHQDSMDKLQEQHVVEIENINAQNLLDLQSLQEQHSNDVKLLQESINALQEAHDVGRIEKESMLTTLTSQLQRVEQEKREVETEKNDLETQFRGFIESSRLSLEQKEQEMQLLSTENVETTNQALKKQKDLLDEQHGVEIDLLTNKHTIALAQADENTEHIRGLMLAVEEQKKELVKELTGLKNKYSLQIENVTSRQDEEKRQLRNTIEELQTSIQNMKNEHRQVVDDHQSTLDIRANEHQYQLNTIVDTHKEEITNALEKQRATLEDMTRVKMDNLEHEYTTKISHMELDIQELTHRGEEAQKNIERLQGENDDLNKKHQEQLDHFEQQRHGLELTNETNTIIARQEIDNLKSEKSVLDNALKTVRQANQDNATRMVDLEASYMSSVAQNEAKLDLLVEAMTEMENEKRELVKQHNEVLQEQIQHYEEMEKKYLDEVGAARLEAENSLQRCEELEMEHTKFQESCKTLDSRMQDSEQALQQMTETFSSTMDSLAEITGQRRGLHAGYDLETLKEDLLMAGYRLTSARKHESPTQDEEDRPCSPSDHISAYGAHGGYGADAMDGHVSNSPQSGQNLNFEGYSDLVHVDVVLEQHNNVNSSNLPQYADQLISAILDGDVQGMLSVVRSKGEDLRSSYWLRANKSILPLHRAITGLHYHGSEHLLVAMVNALLKMGAKVNFQDRAGNTALHKAIQVCTSKSVVNCISALLVKGADPNIVNQDGDRPLHLECRRLRKASVYVLSTLLEAGARPTQSTSALPGGQQDAMPLTLVLQCAHQQYLTQEQENALPLMSAMFNTTVPGQTPSPPKDRKGDRSAGSTIKKKNMRDSRDTWVYSAKVLITTGSMSKNSWDLNWRSPGGDSQLHLLAHCVPGNKECNIVYSQLWDDALIAGFNPLEANKHGRSGLEVLLTSLTGVTVQHFPEVEDLMTTVLKAAAPFQKDGTSSSLASVLDVSADEESCFEVVRELVEAFYSHDHQQRSTTKMQSHGKPIALSALNSMDLTQLSGSTGGSHHSNNHASRNRRRQKEVNFADQKYTDNSGNRYDVSVRLFDSENQANRRW